MWAVLINMGNAFCLILSQPTMIAADADLEPLSVNLVNFPSSFQEGQDCHVQELQQTRNQVIYLPKHAGNVAPAQGIPAQGRTTSGSGDRLSYEHYP